MSLNKLILRTIYMQEENRVRLMAAKLFRKRQDKKKSEYKYMHDWDEPGKAPASDSAKAQGPQIWYCGNKAESDECSCHSIYEQAPHRESRDVHNAIPLSNILGHKSTHF
jgi:hypothetical protein